MKEARDLLTASKQISKLREGSDTDINSDSGFRIRWHTKQMSDEVADAYVGVVGEDGIVRAVNFSFNTYIPIKNFIDLLGQPDEISVIKQEVADATYVEYILYYTQEEVLIFTNTRGLAGPELSDPLGIVYMNLDLNSTALPKWVESHKDLRQPWLGFGKMDEYLAQR